MDVLPKLYRSKMRLYRDRPDVLVTGRWQWCPPGAVAIPYLHRFGSSKYDENDFELPADSVGEVERLPGPVPSNTPPRYTGQRWCGGEEVWTQGALYSQRFTPAVDEEGIPFCCEALPAVGGLAAGGDGVFTYLPQPYYWLRREGLAGLVPGDPIAAWASDGEKTDPADAAPGAGPVALAGPDGTTAGAVLDNETALGVTPLIDPGLYSCWFVLGAKPAGAGAGGPMVGHVRLASLTRKGIGHYADKVRWVGPSTFLEVASALPDETPRLWSWLRRPGAVDLWIDGAFVGSGSWPDSLGGMDAVNIGTTWDTIGGAADSWLYELMVYLGELSSDQLEIVHGYLLERLALLDPDILFLAPGDPLYLAPGVTLTLR